MTDLFEGYAAAARTSGAWDEVCTDLGRVRPVGALLQEALAGVDAAQLRAGATPSGEQGPGPAGDPPLDVVPRVVTAQEWAVVERGLAQRVRAVEAFLADVYGPGRALDDGVVPRRVVTSSPGFHRVAAELEPPGGVRVHVAAVDLVRDAAGVLRVLGDDVRVPRGAGAVLANRAVMASGAPQALARLGVRPVAAHPGHLLAALRASAPPGVDDPTVVVLTPGPGGPGHAELALLAAATGAELVEGRDLLARAGRVHLRTTAGLRPVHVVHRGVPDEQLDPAVFDPRSTTGCPGLVAAARAGGVTIANAVGNGVADDRLVATYLPAMVRYYLAEEPVLEDLPTWRLEDPVARAEVLDRLGDLVVLPADPGGPARPVVGPSASAQELRELRAAVLADPRAWVARPLASVSTAPALVGPALAARRVGLRAFAVHDGTTVTVLPGGLTRVALPQEEPLLATSSGAGVQDTWVLAGDGPAAGADPDGRGQPRRAPSVLVLPPDPSRAVSAAGAVSAGPPAAVARC